METETEYRFSGIKRLYGTKKFEKIKNASVCVIGIGGVGSWAVEGLARSGVASITMIDLDDICITNTNRQLHAMDGNFGKLKVEVMRERILKISPSCKVECKNQFLSVSNMDKLLELKFDYIIDAIDGASMKANLIDYCIKHQRKLITIGAGAGKIDPSKIKFSDLADTENDKLLKIVKQKLRKEFSYSNQIGSYGVEAVYSCERAVFQDEEGETCFKGNLNNKKLDCNTGMGTSSALTGTLGFIAVTRVLSSL